MASRAWEGALWAELQGMDRVGQVAALGEWITFITQELLPALGDKRREMVRVVLEDPDWDAQRLAETIGARTRTIKRLATEGRPARVDEHSPLPVE